MRGREPGTSGGHGEREEWRESYGSSLAWSGQATADFCDMKEADPAGGGERSGRSCPGGGGDGRPHTRQRSGVAAATVAKRGPYGVGGNSRMGADGLRPQGSQG